MMYALFSLACNHTRATTRKPVIIRTIRASEMMCTRCGKVQIVVAYHVSPSRKPTTTPVTGEEPMF